MKSLIVGCAVLMLGCGVALAQQDTPAQQGGSPNAPAASAPTTPAPAPAPQVTTPSTPAPTVNSPGDASMGAKKPMMHKASHRGMMMHHKRMMRHHHRMMMHHHGRMMRRRGLNGRMINGKPPATKNRYLHH